MRAVLRKLQCGGRCGLRSPFGRGQVFRVCLAVMLEFAGIRFGVEPSPASIAVCRMDQALVDGMLPESSPVVFKFA